MGHQNHVKKYDPIDSINVKGKFAIAIPFRDRGKDPLRKKNLDRVLEHWQNDIGFDAFVVDDGRSGYESFNRSAAYNRAAEMTDAEVIVYSESDLLVCSCQIMRGVRLAMTGPGLVVPFSRFMAITPEDSELVRNHVIDYDAAEASQIRGDRLSIGAVNILSRKSLEMIGQWDENFDGAWYDDDSMERAFQICCGPTRFVDGGGYHLYHLPGNDGAHLSSVDRQATQRNKLRWNKYTSAHTPDAIRKLTMENA